MYLECVQQVVTMLTLCSCNITFARPWHGGHSHAPIGTCCQAVQSYCQWQFNVYVRLLYVFMCLARLAFFDLVRSQLLCNIYACPRCLGLSSCGATYQQHACHKRQQPFTQDSSTAALPDLASLQTCPFNDCASISCTLWCNHSQIRSHHVVR